MKVLDFYYDTLDSLYIMNYLILDARFMVL